MLEILFEDEQLIAINKPHGLLVHRSKIATDATEFALQLLRDQINQRVFPCHRLDRKTSGVLLFAKDEVSNRAMQIQFMNNEVQKSYLAILRGWTKDSETIDYPLFNDNGTSQDAITHYTTLAKSELPFSSGKNSTSRYSLVRANPQTGRMHQLRKHFAHIFHPIIGDRPHGCNKQNKLFLERFNMNKMLLHAESLTFQHPINSEKLSISANVSEEFKRMQKQLNLQDSGNQK